MCAADRPGRVKVRMLIELARVRHHQEQVQAQCRKDLYRPTLPAVAVAAWAQRRSPGAEASAVFAGKAFGRYVTGRTLEDDYRVESEVLGTGISGKVTLARCLATGRQVAVKSFNKKVLSERRLEEMRQEVDIHLAVDHPHIVRLDRVYETPCAVHMVLERLDGELFDELVERRCFEEAEAAEVVRQVIRAVAYLHGQGIVHRDIKLENLLLADPNRGMHLKLIDFGFATRWDGKSVMSDRCGTLHYVAPEVLTGAYTSKAEIWSIGTVAYLLLTGKALYSGDDDVVRRKVMKGQFNLTGGFFQKSADAQDFVGSLLHMDPTKRPTALQALDHPWLKRSATGDAEAASAQLLRGLVLAARAPPARRACLAALAWSLPAEAETTLRTAFSALDGDADGVVTAKDLHLAMCKAGSADIEAEDLIKALDANGDGALSFREVLAAIAGADARRADEASTLAAFRRFDTRSPLTAKTTGRGERQDAAQLEEVLGSCFLGLTGEELVASIGVDKDGLVGSEEFAAYLRQSSDEEDEPLNDPFQFFPDQSARSPEICASKNPHGEKGSRSGGRGGQQKRTATAQTSPKTQVSPRKSPRHTVQLPSGFKGCAAEQAAGGLALLFDLYHAVRSIWSVAEKLHGGLP